MSFILPPDIQNLKGNRDIPGLIKALRYPFKSAVRAQAAQALGELGDPRAIPALVEALKDEREEVAKVAAQALAAYGEPAIDPLIGLVMQKKWDGTGWNYRSQAVWLACETLGQIGDPRAIQTLMIASKDSNTLVAAAAEKALQHLQEK